MKKIIAIFLTLVLSFSIVSCGGNAGTAGGENPPAEQGTPLGTTTVTVAKSTGYMMENVFVFLYDENGCALWPKTAVNYTNKTQFVYRINKGVLDISNDIDLNRSMPDDSKRVPFTNMIYIGDGLSDVPCMKMMKAYGGCAIAVYQENNKSKVEELLQGDRVDFIFPADYTKKGRLDKTMHNLIKKIAISDELTKENARQLKELGVRS